MFSITSNESTLKSSEDEMLHDLMDASLEIFEENDYLTQCLLDDTVVVRNRTGSKTMNEFNVELPNEFEAVLGSVKNRKESISNAGERSGVSRSSICSDTEHKYDICNKIFETSCLLKKHEKVHSAQQFHKCAECGAEFTQKANLTRHSVIHSDQKRPFVCDKCGSAFTQIGSLTRHSVVHSDQRRPFICDECGTGFTRKASLVRHADIHLAQNKRSYLCNECGKCFGRKDTRDHHMLVHDNKSSFICNDCGISFIRKGNLTRHMNTIHGTQKNPGRHSCQNCGRHFARKDGLVRHIMEHCSARRSRGASE